MKRLHADILLTFAAMIWGFSFVVQQIGTGTLGTISFTGARFFLGSMVIAPLAWREYNTLHTHHNRSLHPKDWVLMGMVGLILFSAASLQQYGIFHTTVTNSGFLTQLYVIFVPFIGFFAGQKPHFIIWPASLLCLIGLWLLNGGSYTYTSTACGDWWVIASSFFWALHIFSISIVAKRTKVPLILACVQFCTCGIAGLFFGSIYEESSFGMFVSAWKGIFIMGFFSVGIAFTLQVIGQRYTRAADAAILLSSESIFAALGGALFLHERLLFIQYFGAIALFLSIMMIEIVPLIQKRYITKEIK